MSLRKIRPRTACSEIMARIHEESTSIPRVQGSIIYNQATGQSKDGLASSGLEKDVLITVMSDQRVIMARASEAGARDHQTSFADHVEKQFESLLIAYREARSDFEPQHSPTALLILPEKRGDPSTLPAVTRIKNKLTEIGFNRILSEFYARDDVTVFVNVNKRPPEILIDEKKLT